MSGIANVKATMGWQSAKVREACRTCRHGLQVREDRMPPFDRAHWRCLEGGFNTSPMAVCERYRARFA